MIATQSIATTSSEPSVITPEEALAILEGKQPFLHVLKEASDQRFKYFGNKVRIHILIILKTDTARKTADTAHKERGRFRDQRILSQIRRRNLGRCQVGKSKRRLSFLYGYFRTRSYGQSRG